MDDMTQQNAALVEEAAAAAESLHEQTVNLARAVSVFKIEGVEPLAESQAGIQAADETGDFHDPLERRGSDSPMRGSPMRGRTPQLTSRLGDDSARRGRASRVSGTDG
jgi:methyl-accepting chemotaxis protein